MKDLRKKSETDLKKLLAERREDARKFRFDISGSKVKDVREGNNAKKDVARILTELRAREGANNAK
jgi:ribosomal protein L29